MSAPVAREYMTIAQDLEVAERDLKEARTEMKRAHTKVKKVAMQKQEGVAAATSKASTIALWEPKVKEAKEDLQVSEGRVEEYDAKVQELRDELKKARRPKKVQHTYEAKIKRPAPTQKGYMKATVSSSRKTKSALPAEKTVAEPARQTKQCTVKEALKAAEITYENLKTALSKRFQGAITKWRKQYQTAVENLEAAYAAEGTVVDLKSLGGKATPWDWKAAVTASKRQGGAKKRKISDDAETSGPAKRAKADATASPAPLAKRDEPPLAPGQKRKREEEQGDMASAAKKTKSTAAQPAEVGKASGTGITHKPFAQQKFNRSRKLSPREEAMAQEHRKRVKNGRYMAQMSESSDSESKGPAAARKRPGESGNTPAPPAKGAMRNSSQLIGLSNARLACFSNAAIHVIDASLSSAQVSELHGDGYARPHSFDASEKECLKAKKAMSNLKAGIAGAAEGGELSLSAYLGQVLKDLRSVPIDASQPHSKSGPITPFMLQRVFAYSKPDHNKLDGDTEEDSSEWLQKVLQEVFEEKPSLRDLFERKQRTVIRCSALNCTHSHEAAATTELTLNVPVNENEKDIGIQKLIWDALRAEKLPDDYACEDCKRKGTSQKVQTSTELPDNLIVLLDRIDPATNLKKTTRINLEFNDIFVGNEQYRMAAMVRHRSRKQSADSGHYTAFRKHDGKWWQLDDAKVSVVSEADMADNWASQSSYLLLQKVKQ